MPTSKRPTSAAEPPGDLLDLPLGGAADIEREAPQRNLGDVDPIGSLEHRRRPRRGHAGWWWLVLLLAFPLSGLVGYLMKTAPPVAVLSTDLLDFGEVRLGTTGAEQTIRITNQGEQILRLDAATLASETTASETAASETAASEATTEFRVATDGCAGVEVQAQADCAIRLTFTPADRGARRARLQLQSNAPDGPQTVPMIGVGVAPELTVEPPDLDFGRQAVGTASAAAELRIGNRGTAPLQLGRVELQGMAAADFRPLADACSSRLLAPGERCSLRFAFAPLEAGERRAELRIESDADTPRAVSLTGDAILRAPILRLVPEELDFGSLSVARSSPSLTLQLANDGNGPLTVQSLRIEDDPEGREPNAATEPFEVMTEGCTANDIPAGNACEIQLQFRPTAEGAARAFLAIISSASTEPHRISLSGAGTAPHAVMTPERLSFGEIAVRASSTPRTVRITSSGSSELKIGSVAVTGADAVSFTTRGCANTLLVPESDCLLDISFRPQRAGPHRASLRIEHNAGGGGRTLPLNGIGVAARLALDRGQLDFGEVQTGSTNQQPLTLTNAGRSDLKILRLQLTGRQTDFELEASPCTGVTLGPNASCTATISFKPTAAGSHRLRLVIDHTAGDAREVPVTARSTAPPVPEIRLEPARFDFPERLIGNRSTIKTLTLSNPGTGRLGLDNLLIAGEHAGDFQLVPGSCAGTSFITPGASCTVGIRFVPTAAGLRTARLLIRHNAAGAPAALELQGHGASPAPIP